MSARGHLLDIAICKDMNDAAMALLERPCRDCIEVGASSSTAFIRPAQQAMHGDVRAIRERHAVAQAAIRAEAVMCPASTKAGHQANVREGRLSRISC